MNSSSGIRLLYQLAQLYGVQTAYYDVCHCRQPASIESLLAVLRSLGAPVVTLQDIPQAWRERRQAMWQRPLEPVIVAWDNGPNLVDIRLPTSAAEDTLNYHLKLETGEELRGEWRGADQTIFEAAELEGARYVIKRLPLPSGLPWGYHQLVLEVTGRLAESLVISAPVKAYMPPEEVANRSWGVFLPLYSLHLKSSWASGSFSDLEELICWIGGMGGHTVATLPLLAAFMNGDIEASPYLPASRLLWNEFYLDINKVPELPEYSSARALLASPSFKDEVRILRKSPLVDYRQQMALKRKTLQELSRCFFSQESGRLGDLRQFTEANPLVDDYARFRATAEKQGSPWRLWPQPLRDGVLGEGDYDDENRRYHLYVQWLAHQQMANIAERARENGLQLYLDLPLGVHPDGYDVWRERDAFIIDTSAGAPPDAVFTKGQNWGFPPLQPEKVREHGYRYVIAYLRHHLRHAGILRIDHVMGLHRLFCIPDGTEPGQGVYLRYRAEELYAILALESRRNKTTLVGEDLGTVPPYVRPAMKKHGFHRMYVVHYELATELRKGLPKITPNSVASLNTHDMPPFAAFWQGLDIEERYQLGLLDKASAKREKATYKKMREALFAFLKDGGWLKEAEDGIPEVIKACLSFLATSQAKIVLVNLEDLWLETQPQNVPGTKAEYPNWRRKARYTFEEFCQMPQVVDTLRTVDKLRRYGKHQW